MSESHVILGGGPAALNAVETLRQVGSADVRITLVCDEPAYSRMALPYWLSGAIPQEHVLTGDTGYFRQHRVESHFCQSATRVDPLAQTVQLADGSAIRYDKLLIATGSSPREVSLPGMGLSRVQPLWNLHHAEALLKVADGRAHPCAALVGAGFVGLIVLGALWKRGWQLRVVEREPQILPRMLDVAAAELVKRWLATRSVEVHTLCDLQSIEETASGARRLRLANGQNLDADVVIVATGVRPNVGFLEGSGIRTEAGVLVNERMQTNFANVFAAGDVAQGRALYRDRPEVHAIQPTAVDHGRVAGANMAGRDVHYAGSLMMNVLNVCGLQAASFGDWRDAQAEATTIANPACWIYRKFVWREDQLVGAVLTGPANDLGMLGDVGMIKGILQTQTRLGGWRKYLTNNPFDVRRAYIALGVAEKLARTTLIGRPTQDRKYRFGVTEVPSPIGGSHQMFFQGKMF